MRYFIFCGNKQLHNKGSVGVFNQVSKFSSYRVNDILKLLGFFCKKCGDFYFVCVQPADKDYQLNYPLWKVWPWMCAGTAFVRRGATWPLPSNRNLAFVDLSGHPHHTPRIDPLAELIRVILPAVETFTYLTYVLAYLRDPCIITLRDFHVHNWHVSLKSYTNHDGSVETIAYYLIAFIPGYNSSGKVWWIYIKNFSRQKS